MANPRDCLKQALRSFFWGLIFFHIAAHAEILQGIAYLDSMGDIKSRYPNSTFQSIKPAWLQPKQAFYSISGYGMPGTLRIVFGDDRYLINSLLAENSNNPQYDANGVLKKLAAASDNDALEVSWVRWIPSSPIPLERYKQRYGMPKCSFDESMRPICIWDSVALEAQMSEDQKFVLFVTTDFTKQEKSSSWVRKYGIIPNHLK